MQVNNVENSESSQSQRITNSIKTQWGRLIACLPHLDSIGK